MLLRTLAAVSLMASLTTSTFAETPRVVATLKPIHSIVANIMKNVGEPALLMSAEVDPHTYTLKPSEAKLLQDAQLIFWVGPKMEEFLEGPLESIGSGANAVSLMDEKGHDDHEKHDKHEDDHGHEKHAEHEDEHKEEEDDHAGHKEEDHDAHAHDDEKHGKHGEEDAHIWLDPVEMKEAAEKIASALAKADSANAETYETNAKALSAKLDELSAKVKTALAKVKKDGFLTGHDAFRRFEERYGLTSAGSITHHHEAKPGAARIRELQGLIADGKVTCILTEPQSDQGLMKVLTENAKVKTVSVDPSGSTFEPGPDLYFVHIESIASAFQECLGIEK